MDIIRLIIRWFKFRKSKMIDIHKVVPIIESYKQNFTKNWEDEKYKWEAVKHFHDNWNIDAPNYEEMFILPG